MSKVSRYFGLKKYTDGPVKSDEQRLGMPVVYSLALIGLVVFSVIMNIPAEGIPSRLYGYLDGVRGGGNWLAADGLSQVAIMLSWATYFYWYALLLVALLLLYRAASRARRVGIFEAGMAQAMHRLNLLLSLGYAFYLLLIGVTEHLIAGSLGLPYRSLPGIWEDPSYLVVFMFVVAMWLVVALIDRGGELQEEADSTI